MKFFPDLQASDGKSCNHRSRKRSISAARRLKTRLRLTMTKERLYTESREERTGQTFEVNEVRENHDAAVHGNIFFVTDSFLVC